jgi:uncharacterized protein (TIGR03435 family)
MTKLALTLAALLLGQAATQPQPLPVYDAVTIKPSNSPESGVTINMDETNFAAHNATLKILIANAFNVRPALIYGLPAWAGSERYDLTAKVTDPDLKRMKTLPLEQRGAMAAVILAERFHLKIHFETKTLPVYELVIAKGGARLTPTAVPDPLASNGKFSVHNSEITATDTIISNFAVNLSYQLDRNVIDKTGLTGRYDFRLTWTPDNLADSAPSDAPPTLITAIEEQLGLKLQPAKGPVPTIVVDHVEHPTSN